MAVRQDGMVQFTGRQDLTLDQPKVLVDVRVTRMCNEGRVSFRVDRGFVDPRVQGGHIDVMDLLTGGHLMVQFHGIGTSSAESVAWIEGRPVPIVLVKCWNVAHWNAKKLLKNCQKSKKLLPKFQKLLPKFLAIFI